MIADVEQNVAAKALDVGEAAPDFTLHQAGSDTERSLAAALANGPVVLSFYRGQW
jgi:peroxiredoxin